MNVMDQMIAKKGVSPLIATVLLLAFAVSIATIVVQLEPFTGGCSIYAAEVVKVNGQQKICYNKNMPGLEVVLKNGKYDIIGAKISVTGEKDVANSKVETTIEKNTVGKLNVSYSIDRHGEPSLMVLAPVYNKSGNFIECRQEVDIKDFRPCK